ncbi:hypothetical protein BP5796_07293 [Coleophoma crateriformis]|uniref:Uncharacterized protein n=1 Tax=Coleophoma crateriformis TaxID=565419 RepID=A0A3D8RJ31_9HELO|nr:hypothetical protein BP5796_07293 [Coleophoma crateriformis]
MEVNERVALACDLATEGAVGRDHLSRGHGKQALLPSTMALVRTFTRRAKMGRSRASADGRAALEQAVPARDAPRPLHLPMPPRAESCALAKDAPTSWAQAGGGSGIRIAAATRRGGIQYPVVGTRARGGVGDRQAPLPSHRILRLILALADEGQHAKLLDLENKHQASLPRHHAKLLDLENKHQASLPRPHPKLLPDKLPRNCPRNTERLRCTSFADHNPPAPPAKPSWVVRAQPSLGTSDSIGLIGLPLMVW